MRLPEAWAGEEPVGTLSLIHISVWCSDITYIWTIDGFVYLTSIMDLYSRKIIAWTLSKTLEAVSYTHLDVYKRQIPYRARFSLFHKEASAQMHLPETSVPSLLLLSRCV